VHTSNLITLGRHALINDDIGKLSYDLDLAHKIRNKDSAIFLQLIKRVGFSWVRKKHKQPTIGKITQGNEKEFKYAHANLHKSANLGVLGLGLNCSSYVAKSANPPECHGL
jgi:hypothetical protein